MREPARRANHKRRSPARPALPSGVRSLTAPRADEAPKGPLRRMSFASQGDPRPPKRLRSFAMEEARAPAPSTFLFASRQRGPPPAAWGWQPPLIDLDFQNLPPLPAIRSEALAQQAVTSKQWLGSVAGRPDHFTYDDELASYRRLEYLGDAVLYPALAKQLFRLFPNAGSGVLSVSRTRSNKLRRTLLISTLFLPLDASRRAPWQLDAVPPRLGVRARPAPPRAQEPG